MGTCLGATSVVCKNEGSGFESTECDADLGLSCYESSGKCTGACAPDASQRSYIGCEYFATVTSNSGLFDGFQFSVVVTNTASQPAQIKVLRGADVVATETVAGKSLKTIALPWVPELKHNELEVPPPSSLVIDGAYHIKSTQPVTVYQFNPLEFSLKPSPPGCPDFGTGECNSYTNDASLLLPRTAQGSEYMVASLPPLVVKQSFDGKQVSLPGMVSITGLEDATQVTFTSTANVIAGVGVNAMKPGDTQTFTLGRGDVVQLLTAPVPVGATSGCVPLANGNTSCQPGKGYDLTGSFVKSDRPVQVIGGHDCTFIPYGTMACDHVEETIFPVSTLGSEVIVGAPQSIAGAMAGNGKPDKHFIRVISAVDGNVVQVDPPIFAGGVLNKGQFSDIPSTDQDLIIKGTGPLLVAQFLLSGDALTPGSTGMGIGDPGMSLAVPSSQYRKSYSFLAPETYTYNFVTIIAQQGTTVTLDGQPITGFAPVGSSKFGVKRQKVSGGAHNVQSDVPFGIVVHGYASYTSYIYPGGLDLNAAP